MMPQFYLTFNPDLSSFSKLQVLDSIDYSKTTTGPLLLQNQWTVWEQIENNAAKDYANNMKPVMRFNSVQGFWTVWDQLPQPSWLMTDNRMVRKTDDGESQFVDGIMIFRDDVQPMWEDPINACGGHFETRYFMTQNKAEQAMIDEHWNNLVLGMIGSQIDPAGMITGIRLVDKLHSARGFLRIEVWFTEVCGVDSKNLLRESLEDTMLTNIEGNRVPYTIQWHMKKHSRGAK